MAGFLNKVMIMGNVGRDPEMRYTPNGSAVTTFSVAVNRQWSGQDGQRHEETEWFTVETWAKLAETCNQSLEKGQKVFVEGRLRTRSWEGQDGQKRYRTEVVATSVLFLSSRNARGGGSAAMEDSSEADVEPDDIPF